METRAKWQYALATLALVWGLGVGGRPAQAGPPTVSVCPVCAGPTLGPGGSFALTCDMSCAVGPALTVDSASLDMKGHTVTCTDNTIDGIVVQGFKAKVQNGTVTGCYDGVELQGTGHHEVRNVTSSYNANIGFEELEGSSANKLTNDTASYNGTLIDGHSGGSGCDFVEGASNGFSLDGGHDVLSNDTAIGNLDTGVEIDGDGNSLTKVISNDSKVTILCDFGSGVYICDPEDCDDSGGEGFAISGDSNHLLGVTANDNRDNGVNFNGQNNRVEASTANDNDESGFIVIGGGNNQFFSNTANNNDNGFSMYEGAGGNTLNGNKADGEDEGFHLQTPNNILVGNKATNNSIGFNLEDGGADNNLLQNNVATNNNTSTDDEYPDAAIGIKVHDGASGNTITKNKVSGSGTFDLEDNNAGCDSNTWTSNSFGTRSQGCIN
jgi:parallel beta-helix repeat protein